MQCHIIILYYTDVNNLCFYIYHSSVMSVLHSAHCLTDYKFKIHIRIEDKINTCFNKKSTNANEL